MEKSQILKEIENRVKDIENEEGFSNEGNAFCFWAVNQVLFDKFEDNKEDMIFPEKNDQGIDFFWIDKEENTLYLGQSKKNEKIDHKIVNDLLKSYDFLINENLPKKQDLLMRASIEAREFIKNNRDYKIKFMFFGLGEISPNAIDAKKSHKIENHPIEFYDGSRLISIFEQNRISEQGNGVKEISLNIEKNKYHKYSSPKSEVKESFVCAIDAEEIARIFREHGEKIFSSNVRRGLGNKNKINADIKATIYDDKEREYFYFYNNGICIVCNGIKEEIEGNKIKLKLSCASIVNGGQTTRQLYECTGKLEEVVVLVKIFVSENKEIINNIAIYNNSQTAVTSADLLSNSIDFIKLYDSCKSAGYYFERQRGLLDDEYSESRDKKKEFGVDWKEKIIKPKEIGQAYLSFMGFPALARGKSKIIFERDNGKFDYIFKDMTSMQAIILWKLWILINEKIKEISRNKKGKDVTYIKYGKFFLLQYFGLYFKEKVINKDKKKNSREILESYREIPDSKEYEFHVKNDFDKNLGEINEKEIEDLFEDNFHEAFDTIKGVFDQAEERSKDAGKNLVYNDYCKSESSQKDLFKEFYKEYAKELKKKT